jgi:uncharacterized membrane protein YkvA (DUF1232 family)
VRALLQALPTIIRALVGIAADPSLPRAAKIALGAAALYLASPIDLVPDFIPLLGYVDDLLLAAILVDGILNFADRSLVRRYWPGRPASLDKVARTAHLLTAWVPRRVKERIFSPRPR